MFQRHYFPGNDYDTDLKTIRRNLRSSWVTEKRSLPDQPAGAIRTRVSMYHASLVLRVSLLGIAWNIPSPAARSGKLPARPRGPPRTTRSRAGSVGSFLAKRFSAMASLVLERGSGAHTAVARVFRGSDLSVARLQSARVRRSASGRSSRVTTRSITAALPSREPHAQQNSAGASGPFRSFRGARGLSIDYGLPGKSDYVYRRPFDYSASRELPPAPT
jgi:hypothetical protein